MSSKPIFLDVDSSITEKNYLITKETQEEGFEQFFGPSATGQLASRLIKPTPGFCVKTKEKSSNKKVFINVCQTDAIPPPKDISEAELIHIMDTDEIVDYRIPMSIGDVRSEPDKKGEDSSVCDIAVNPKFFEKINTSEVFREFFLAVAFEALQQKHKIYTETEKRILQNKKAHGTLQMQRIQKREVEKKMGMDESLPSVDEILNRTESGKGKIIEVISDKITKTPEYRFFKKTDDDNILYAEVHLPYIISSKELTLDIGEDRIILESTNGTYFLDTYHNQLIDQSGCNSFFNKDTKFLTVTMPIKTC